MKILLKRFARLTHMLNTDGHSKKPKGQCGTFDQLAEFVKTLDNLITFTPKETVCAI
jgi:hypothetical protein